MNRRKDLRRKRIYSAETLEKRRLSYRAWCIRNRDSIRIRRKQYCLRNASKIKAQQAEWRLKNRQQLLARKIAYRNLRRDHYNKLAEAWRKSHPEERKEYQRKYYLLHQAEQIKAAASWTKENRSKVNSREKNRKRNDPSYRIRCVLGSRLSELIRRAGGKKCDKAMTLTGCSWNCLKEYLQKRFRGEMQWNNYGRVWEIDHRFPCVSFDLTIPEEQKRCFHYTNLQPLLCSENRRKSRSLPKFHQLEYL